MGGPGTALSLDFSGGWELRAQGEGGRSAAGIELGGSRLLRALTPRSDASVDPTGGRLWLLSPGGRGPQAPFRRGCRESREGV